MFQREFYVWLMLTILAGLLAIVAAIAFLLGADYGVGLGIIVALMVGVMFGGCYTWRVKQQWEKYDRRMQRRQLPLLRRMMSPTDSEYHRAYQEAQEVVISWALDQADHCVVDGHCQDCGASHELLRDYPWDPMLHQVGCRAQEVKSQFDEIQLAPMVELLQCRDLILIDRLEGEVRQNLIRCIERALIEAGGQSDWNTVLRGIAQEYQGFVWQQENDYGLIELGQKLVSEVEQLMQAQVNQEITQ
jgi:hypothetical protein